MVTIAIISLLTAILLPAVQSAREASRRMVCRSNLRQLGLAIHNYHDVHRRLPPGCIPQGERYDYGRLCAGNGSPEVSWSWSVFLLPYLEQSGLYDTIDPGRGPQGKARDSYARALVDPAFKAAFQTPLPVFRCPSDAAPEVSSRWGIDETGILTSMLDESSPNDATHLSPPVSNYLGNNSSSGLHPFRRYREANSRSCLFNSQVDGLFWPYSSVRFEDITDGLSNTIMLGERAHSRKILDNTDLVSGAGVLYITNTYGQALHRESRAAFCTIGINQNVISTGLYGQLQPFNVSFTQTQMHSMHQKGVNVLMSDGSVHFLSETIDLDLTDNANDDQTDDLVLYESVPGDRPPNSVLESMFSRNDGGSIGSF